MTSCKGQKGVSLGHLVVKSPPKNAATWTTEHAFMNAAEILSWTHKREVTKFCPVFVYTTCMMATSNSSSSSSRKDSKSEAITKRGHYRNYLSQPNAKIPKTTFYHILNKSKVRSEDNLTCASENVLPDNKDLEVNVFGPLQNELNCSIHAQLSSSVHDNPEILDASGIPTCSRHPSHLESEVPTSLGSSEF